MADYNPAVALGINPPGATGGAMADPFHMMNEAASFGNAMLQNQMNRQKMAGINRMGEILSQAPDQESAWNAIMKDPTAAPWAGEALNNYRQGLWFQRQFNESVTREANTGLEAINKFSPALYSDPDQWLSQYKAAFNNMSPEAQARARPGFNAVLSGLTDGLSTDPATRAQQWNSKVNAFVMGSLGSQSPEVIRAVTGQPAPSVQQVTMPDGRIIPMTYGAPLGSTSPVLTAPGGIGGGGAPGSPMPYSATTGGVPTPGPGQATVAPAGGAPPGGQPPAGAAPTLGGTDVPDLSGAVGLGGVPDGPPAGVAPAAPGPQAGGAAGGVAPGIGQTTEQKGIAEATAKNAGDLQTDMNAMAGNIPKATYLLDTLQDSVQHFLAGGGAQARATVAQFEQGLFDAFGVPQAAQDSLIKQAMAGGELDKQQLFHAVVSMYAIRQLKEAAQGTGRVMRSEVDVALNGISETMDPKALEAYLNTQGRRAVQLDYDRVQAYRNQFQPLVASGQENAANFPMWYSDHAVPYNRLPQYTTGGLHIGPRDPAEAYGVPSAPAPSAVYNPATGGFDVPPPAAPTPQAPVAQ